MKPLHHRLEATLASGLQVQVAVSALLYEVPGEEASGKVVNLKKEEYLQSLKVSGQSLKGLGVNQSK